MESQKTAAIVKAWYDSIGSGDFEAVMNGLAEDVRFELPLDEHNKVIPYLGTHCGRAAVAQAFRTRGETTEVLQYETRLVRAQDNDAFIIVYTKARCRETGAEFEIEDLHRQTLNEDGKIAFWKVYFDPNTEVAAFKKDIDQRLIAAVGRGDVAAVKHLLSVGAPPNARDADGLTALMIAAGRGDEAAVSELLAAGADVHTTEPRGGTTALHKACQGGNVNVVRRLVEAGCSVDAAAATTGHTPLWDALWYKYPDVVQFLLDKGAGLGTKAYYGFTLEEHIRFEENVNPTEEAREKFRKARAIVEARVRADRQAADRQQLMAAVTRGDLATVRELLAKGAPVDERSPKQNGFNDLHTPLLVACRDGHTEIARELIRAGADVNAVEPTFGAVPLHKSVYNGHAGITQLLAEQPGIDLDFQGATNGYTPLHDALWHGYRDCARILLQAGARLDVRGHDGKRPLEIAVATFGYDDALVADLRARTPDEAAPPSRAARDGRLPFFIQMRWNIEGRLSFDDLWDLELKEAEWAMTSGPQAQLWKVAGDKRLVGIVHVDSIHELDRVIMGRLPMREFLEFEEIWPLRSYGEFVEDVKKHYRV
jgi:ankyrin repeat protein